MVGVVCRRVDILRIKQEVDGYGKTRNADRTSGEKTRHYG